MTRSITSLSLFVVALSAMPAHAGFYGMSDYDVKYTVDRNVNPPQYWLQGFAFIDQNVPLEDLVVGESTGVVNVTGAGDITAIDDFDLNSYAPRNGASPQEIQTKNFGGSPTWQDMNGDGYDFFVFEIGRNDQFAVQAILPGGVLGEKVIVPQGRWSPSTAGEPDINLNCSGGPNNDQKIGGIAFKITDLLDENGNPLTNKSVIEGLQFSSPGMDPSCVCAVKGSAAAFNPAPPDKAVISDARPVLTWSAGAGAVLQRVYFSRSFDDVESTADSALAATTAQTVLVIWGAGTPYPDGLPSETYYWRVVTIKTDQAEVAGPVWSFTVLPRSAHNPTPVDGAIFVGLDVDLSWSAGVGAMIHYVHFGIDRDAVASATGGTPVPQATFDPGPLANGTTYYWRVDEFDGTGTVVGELWSFSTLPAGTGGLRGDYYSGVTDLSGNPTVTRVDPQIDFNWNQTPPAPTIDREAFSVRWSGEIEIPVADTYTFTTRSNDGSRMSVNNPLIIDDWGTHTARDTSGTLSLEAGRCPIMVEYMQQGGNATISVSWQSSLIPKQVIPSAVLSPVVRASLPSPANGAADVSQNPRLTWSGISTDARHDLYLGDDADAVAQATATTAGIYKGRLDVTTTIVENLQAGRTYYWRVDEVVAGDPQSPIKGNLWSFTTAEFLVLDDFENYLDLEPDRIFDKWMDGWDNPSNGSTIGYPEPDFAAGEHFVETGFVHGGKQSAPMLFDNSGTARYSEASLALTPPRDWTIQGIDTLVLWYRGVAPQGSFAYDADKDKYTISASGTGIEGTSDGFRFAHKQLSGNGTITVRVDSLQNTDVWAVSGVMIRNTLDPGSIFAMCGVRAAGEAFLRWRTAADTDIAGTVEEPQHPATIVLPHWVRLSRQGNSFTAEHSSDAVSWEPIGNPVTVAMNQQVYVGLAVSANVGVANPATTTSVLSMPVVTGAVSPAGPFDTVVDVGMSMNPPEQLYVVVEDSTGRAALVTNPDNPAAVQSPAWTKWMIDLQAIGSQGVNLRTVKTLTIGVGSRAATAPGGAGTLYIDDIGLHDAGAPTQ